MFAAEFFAEDRLVASAGAVDGTVDINQAKVLATGGFPFLIGTSGSYRLTVVPANTNGIVVTTNNVTIDLNGFSIVGPAGNGIEESKRWLTTSRWKTGRSADLVPAPAF
jgi:hypothetical protein